MNILDIKRELKNRKISYSKLSQNTGIPLSTLKAIFGGKTKSPRLDTLKLICEYLDIGVNRLVYNEINVKEGENNEIAELIENYRKLNKEQRQHVRIVISTFLQDKEKIYKEIFTETDERNTDIFKRK
jgi:DNA-binding Xre family transcriptional regulator